jgi:hypothetical protein
MAGDSKLYIMKQVRFYWSKKPSALSFCSCSCLCALILLSVILRQMGMPICFVWRGLSVRNLWFRYERHYSPWQQFSATSPRSHCFLGL